MIRSIVLSLLVGMFAFSVVGCDFSASDEVEDTNVEETTEDTVEDEVVRDEVEESIDE